MQFQEQSLSFSVFSVVVQTQGQWRMKISGLRGAAGALYTGLCVTNNVLALSNENSCLIISHSRFTGSLPLWKTLSLLSYNTDHPLFSFPSGMRKSPDLSPRRLSDISPQLRQLKYLVVDEAIKEDLKSSRSVEDINSASIEERILRITGYYGYQPWNASYKSESVYMHGAVNFCECMLWYI